jgi:hypothetical protein
VSEESLGALSTDDLIARVVAEIDRHRGRLTSGPGFASRQYAAAALARGRALWDALVAVEDAGQEVVAGLLTRAIWECWVVGMFLVLEQDQAFITIVGDTDRAARLMNERWPDKHRPPNLGVTGWPEKKVNYEDLARRVTKRLAETPGAVQTMSYDGLYRSWSMMSAHPTHMSLTIFLEDSGKYLQLGPGRSPMPPGADRNIAASFLGHLAWFVFSRFSISPDRLLAATLELHRRRLNDIGHPDED